MSRRAAGWTPVDGFNSCAVRRTLLPINPGAILLNGRAAQDEGSTVADWTSAVAAPAVVAAVVSVAASGAAGIIR